MQLQTEFIESVEEITEDKYFYMLGCLPPRLQTSNAFLVGEATTHGKDMSKRFAPLYELYFEKENRFFFGGLASVSDFKSFLIP